MAKSDALEGVLDGLRKADAEDGNAPAFGWTCTYIPVEILESAGLMPYRILPDPRLERADAYLDPNFCPLIKTSLGCAMEGDYDFLEGVVMANTCDGMRRLYDAWRYYGKQPSMAYLLDVPRVVTPESIDYFSDRLKAFARALEERFDCEITDAGLSAAIAEANRTRSLLSRLFDQAAAEKGGLPFTDITRLIDYGLKVPRETFNQALGEAGEIKNEVSRDNRPLRVVVSGSPLQGGPLVRLVEELGAQVVALDTCSGGRILEPIEASGDPFHRLAEAYLQKVPCARMNDTERRTRYIEDLLRERRAHGLIYFSLKFCDPYLYEAPSVRERLERSGLPVLFLEGEYSGRFGGGTRTRVQAFLEMLEQRWSARNGTTG